MSTKFEKWSDSWKQKSRHSCCFGLHYTVQMCLTKCPVSVSHLISTVYNLNIPCNFLQIRHGNRNCHKWTFTEPNVVHGTLKPPPQTQLRRLHHSTTPSLTLTMVSLSVYFSYVLLFLPLVASAEKVVKENKSDLFFMSSHFAASKCIHCRWYCLLCTLQRSPTMARPWVPAALLFGSDTRGSPLACSYHLHVEWDEDNLWSCLLTGTWSPKVHSLYYDLPVWWSAQVWSIRIYHKATWEQ